MEDEIKDLLSELIVGQKKKLLKMGREIVPRLTEEDVLQPNDYPELESNPLFRYEEGVLEGLQTTEMAMLAWLKDRVELLGKNL
ncbi:MAG: hypothetical protein S4CHLAM6_08860 [Chlamydiae bacterium]|nr:hypothetical protein [Chlamydiota bacterium]